MLLDVALDEPAEFAPVERLDWVGEALSEVVVSVRLDVAELVGGAGGLGVTVTVEGGGGGGVAITVVTGAGVVSETAACETLVCAVLAARILLHHEIPSLMPGTTVNSSPLASA